MKGKREGRVTTRFTNWAICKWCSFFFIDFGGLYVRKLLGGLTLVRGLLVRGAEAHQI